MGDESYFLTLTNGTCRDILVRTLYAGNVGGLSDPVLPAEAGQTIWVIVHGRAPDTIEILSPSCDLLVSWVPIESGALLVDPTLKLQFTPNAVPEGGPLSPRLAEDCQNR